ncbi:hypothetical protein PINS_up021966 [Pythium insidiosum]|nr:hypothetical protein PINS_up021966 [Pythium insidiosum]
MATPPVPYVVVFNELSPKAKARYTRFLLDNNFGSGMMSREVTGMYMRDVKILKLINEIYDHRYEELGDNNTDVKALWCPTLEAPRPQEADGGFVKYLHRYFLNRFGLKTLVEQQMRELIEGVQVWEELNEVKRFLGFIDGTLDDNSLHFFLHVRNATQVQCFVMIVVGLAY